MGKFIRDAKITMLYMLELPWTHDNKLSEQRLYEIMELMKQNSYNPIDFSTLERHNELVSEFHSEFAKKYEHWVTWLLGWTWSLAGLVLGAFVAPQLLQNTGLTGSPYQDWIEVAIAVLSAFLVQMLGWFAVALVRSLANLVALTFDRLLSYNSPSERIFLSVFTALIIVAGLAPFAGVGYSIYRYLSWVGAGQREVTIALAGGLLVKTFGIPLIKGIVTGALFRWFMKWLRGGKDKQNA